MEKRISFDQFQSVKRVAQACNPLMVKREKIRKQIEGLATVYKDYDTQIASLEAGIKAVIGCRVEDIVKKVIESGTDANGKPKKTTKYLPTSMVSYDETKKQYVINIPTPASEEPTTDVTTPSESADMESNPSEELNETPSDAPIFE